MKMKMKMKTHKVPPAFWLSVRVPYLVPRRACCSAGSCRPSRVGPDDSLPIQAAMDYPAPRCSAATRGVVYARGDVHVIGAPGAKDNQPLS
jgi:hypothetical protein